MQNSPLKDPHIVFSDSQSLDDDQDRALNCTTRPVDRRLSSCHRIVKSDDFRRVFDEGRHCAGRLMVVWLQETDNACWRLGVIASKRTLRRSVDRNRARRLLREAFRLNRFKFKAAADVVIIARRRILEASVHDVESELLALISRLDYLDKSS